MAHFITEEQAGFAGNILHMRSRQSFIVGVGDLGETFAHAAYTDAYRNFKTGLNCIPHLLQQLGKGTVRLVRLARFLQVKENIDSVIVMDEKRLWSPAAELFNAYIADGEQQQLGVLSMPGREKRRRSSGWITATRK